MEVLIGVGDGSVGSVEKWHLMSMLSAALPLTCPAEPRSACGLWAPCCDWGRGWLGIGGGAGEGQFPTFKRNVSISFPLRHPLPLSADILLVTPLF